MGYLSVAITLLIFTIILMLNSYGTIIPICGQKTEFQNSSVS